MDVEVLQTAPALLGADAKHAALWTRTPLKIVASAANCAQQLFAVPRGFDDMGVKPIWVATPPEDAGQDGLPTA